MKVYYKDHVLYDNPEEDSVEVECDAKVIELIREKVPFGFRLDNSSGKTIVKLVE